MKSERGKNGGEWGVEVAAHFTFASPATLR